MPWVFEGEGIETGDSTDIPLRILFRTKKVPDGNVRNLYVQSVGSL